MRVQKTIKPDVNILCLNYNRSWTESFLSLECNVVSNLPLNVTIIELAVERYNYRHFPYR